MNGRDARRATRVAALPGNFRGALSSLPIVNRPAAERAEPRPNTAQLPELRDEDLYPLLEAFYATVEREPLLAPYFAPVDMTAHMPRIVDFWSTLLFHTARYSGTAFRPHAMMPGLTGEHFARLH